MTALSGQDLAFVAFESASRPMHISVVGEFALPPGRECPSLAQLRAAVGEMVAREPRLRRQLVWAGRFRAPRWAEAESVDLEHHVRALGGQAGESLDQRVDSTLAAPLDRDRPLFEIWSAPSDHPSRFRVLLKVHHALVDGVGGGALLQSLLGGERPARPQRRRQGRARAGARARWTWRSVGRLLRFVFQHFRSSPRTPLNGRPGPARRHHHFPVDATTFDTTARELGGTRNDLMLALVSGGLHRWLARTGRGGLDGFRAYCPVDLRGSQAGGDLGNRISTWFVPLPTSEPELAGRVAALRRVTARRKRSRAAESGVLLARCVARLGGWAAAAAMSVAGARRAFNLVVSSVPGPSHALSLLDTPLESIAAPPPLVAGQRVTVCALRYEGQVMISLQETLPDPIEGRALAASLREELEASIAKPTVAP